MDFKSGITETLIRLCAIKSTSGTEEEVSAAEKIYSLIYEIPYFKEHKEHIILHNIESDFLGRKFVSALYNNGMSKKTVILLSHFDVVGVEEFGHLKKYAYDPVEYTKVLKNENLPTSVESDLSSEDWLFGRGTMDMKCGLAIHIEILKFLCNGISDIDGNILLITVPDEENSSAGMLSAVKYISELKNKGYEFTGVINTEPFLEEYPGDDNKYIYTGTIGKLLPFVSTAGLETHASDPFAGLSSSLLSSTIINNIENNTTLCEKYGNAVSPPPVCLKQYDIKELYSVSTPSYSFAYYNYFTLHSSPDDVLCNVKKICLNAFDEVLIKIKEAAKKYSYLSGKEIPDMTITPCVMTYDELVNLLQSRGISSENMKQKYKDCRMDTRDITGYIIMDMLKAVPDLRPVVIIGFAPPYYPHRIPGSKHKNILDVCHKVIERSREIHNKDLIHREIFQGLCDLSYLGFENPNEYHTLEYNMPVFNMSYSLPVNYLSSIDIGGINIGVMGRDVHKYTERLNIPYSMNVTPDLVLYAINELLSYSS